METTTEDWMIEQHLCRCCHSEGKFKSLLSTDPLMENELLFIDAIRFCLDIKLCLVEGPLADAACRICETCVARLQEACSFRGQVLYCEGRFQTLYSQNRIKVASLEPVVKEELTDPDDSHFEDIPDGDKNSLYIEVALSEPLVKEELPDPDEKPEEKRQKPKPRRVLKKRDRPRTAPADHLLEGKKKKTKPLRGSDYKQIGDKIKCTQCSTLFNNYGSLRLHIIQHQLAKHKYKCTLCNASFRTNVQFVRHKLNEHNIDDRLKCNACDSIFNTQPQLIRHKNSSHMLGEKYKCPQCDYDCFTAAALRKHKSKHKTVKDNHISSSEPVVKEELPDPDETRKVTEVYRLLDSDYEKTGDKFTCTRCSKTLTSMDTLRWHIKCYHLNITPFKCTVCNTSFRTKIRFVKHKLDEHNIDDRFKCNACDKMFNTKQQLDIHKNIFHMLGTKLKCQQCDYECFSLTKLKRHKIKHQTVKDYHCKYCKKSFLRRTNLLCHEKIHTGDRRKICAECGQAFVQKASLNYHMTKYHPEVNY